MYVCIFKIDQLEGGKEKETKRNGGMCQGPVLGKRARVGGRARAHVCARCWSALLRACMLVGLVGNSGRGYIVKGEGENGVGDGAVASWHGIHDDGAMRAISCRSTRRTNTTTLTSLSPIARATVRPPRSFETVRVASASSQNVSIFTCAHVLGSTAEYLAGKRNDDGGNGGGGRKKEKVMNVRMRTVYLGCIYSGPTSRTVSGMGMRVVEG